MSHPLQIDIQEEHQTNDYTNFLLGKGYKVIKQIGKGYYGVVYKATDLKENRTVAIKGMVFNSTQEQEKLENEYNCLKSINHPNVIRVYEYIPYHENNCGFYSMEFCQGKIFEGFKLNRSDLAGVLEKHRKQKHWLKQSEIYHISLQVLQGLKAIHSKNIIHFNISCENILLSSDGVYKIGDFGECKQLIQGESTTKTHVINQFGIILNNHLSLFNNNKHKMCELKSKLTTFGFVLFVKLQKNKGECSRKYGSPEQLHKLLQSKDSQEYSFSIISDYQCSQFKKQSDIYSLGIVYYYLTNRTLEYENVPTFKKIEFISFLNPEYNLFNRIVTQMIQFKQEERIRLQSLENQLQSLIDNNLQIPNQLNKQNIVVK